MNVHEAFAKAEYGDYRITIFGTTSRGRRRNLTTVVGGPGKWRTDSAHHVDKSLSRAVQAVAQSDPGDAALEQAAREMISTWTADSLQTVLGLPLRGEIPWSTVSIVCDVVYASDQRSIDIDALRVVATQHGSRISALGSISGQALERAEAALHAAIRSVVVLPSD